MPLKKPDTKAVFSAMECDFRVPMISLNRNGQEGRKAEGSGKILCGAVDSFQVRKVDESLIVSLALHEARILDKRRCKSLLLPFFLDFRFSGVCTTKFP